MPSMSSPRLVISLLLTALVACSARVDEPRYAAGDPAVATFENASDATVWLSGCSAFGFQKRESEGWVDRGSPLECVWEGFAQPVAGRSSRTDPFAAPNEPGTWRLRYPAGLQCASDRPLSPNYCQVVRDVVTAPFEVVDLCDPSACGPALGMPNWLCPDGSVGGPTGRCLSDPKSGACGWEIRSCPR